MTPAPLSTPPGRRRSVRTTAPDPARTLVRLKLRLIANRAKSSRRGVLQLVVSVVLLALILGCVGALMAGVLAADPDPRISRTAAVIGATALTVGWALLPLLSVGSDETLDPGRLVAVPAATGHAHARPARCLAGRTRTLRGDRGLRRRASSASWPSGAGSRCSPSPRSVVLSAVTARALSTTLAAGLSSRRGRDALIVFASVFFIAVQGVRFIRWDAIGPAARPDRRRAALDPPGMLGQAAFDSSQGHHLPPWLELIVPLVVIPLLVPGGPGCSTARSPTSPTARPGRRGWRRAGDLPLLIEALPFLRRALGRGDGQGARYLAREPRRKVNLVNSVIIGVGLPVWAALHVERRRPGQGRAARHAGRVHRGARQQQPVRPRRRRRVDRHGRRSHGPHRPDRQEPGRR